MKPANHIVGTTLRVTDDFRDKTLQTAGDKLATRVIERRQWLADLDALKAAGRDNVLHFGGALRTGSAAK